MLRKAQFGAGGPWPAAVNNVGGQEQAINLLSGNGFFSHSELSLPAYATSLDVTRSYNHQNRTKGLLGWGWRLSLENGLELYRSISGLSHDIAIWQDDSGTEYEFPLAGLGPVGTGDVYPRVDGIKRDWPRLSAEGQGYRLRWSDGGAALFNANGQLTAWHDQRDQERVTYGYDNQTGLLSTVNVVGTGRSLSLATDGAGLLRTITVVGTGYTTVQISFGYANGNLTSVTGLNGREVTFGYDSYHRLNQISHSLPQEDGTRLTAEIGWQYGSQNRLSDVRMERDDIDPTTLRNAVEFRSVTYAPESAVVTDPAGRSVFEWDSQGRLARTARELKQFDSEGQPIDPQWLQQHFEYDGHDLTSYIDPLGRQTQYTYDQGFVSSEALPDKQTKRTYDYEFYADGRPMSVTASEAAGANSVKQNETETTYNVYGEPIKVVGPYVPDADLTDALTTTYEYNSDGLLTDVIDPWGFRTHAEYLNGQVSQTTDWPMTPGAGSADSADSEWTTTQYDPFGQVSKTETKLTDRDTLRTEYQQDYSTGRLTVTHHQPAGTAEMSYRDSQTVVDYRSTYADVTTPVKVTRQYLDDPSDRLVAGVYHYNRSGMLLRADTAGGEFVHRYDALGNTILEVDRAKPTGSLDPAAVDNVRYYTYDSAGRLTRAENALTGYILYQYDAAGRLIHEEAYTPQNVGDEWEYSPDQTQEPDLKVDAVTYRYDDLDRWIYSSSPVTGEQSVQYEMRDDGLHVTMMCDNKDPITGETHPKGMVEVYDRLGRLSWRGSGTSAVTYRQLKRSDVSEYPSDSRLQRIIALPAIEAVQDTYDEVSGRKLRTETVTMHIDGRGRTVAETTAPAARTRKGNTSVYYYDGLDRTLGGEVTDDDGSTIISFWARYDAFGQVYSERSGDITHGYRYNLLGNPLWEGSRKDYGAAGGALNTYYSYSYDDVTQLQTVDYGMGLFTPDRSEATIDESYGLDYGDDGYVSEMSSDGEQLLGFTWDRMGNLTRFCRGDGRAEKCGAFGYDKLGRYAGVYTPGKDYRRFNWQIPDQAASGTSGSLPGLLAARTTAMTAMAASTGSQPAGLVFSKVYSGFVLNQKHPDGTVTQRVIDSEGNVVAEVANLGAVTRYEYDLNGHLKAKTDANGVRTQYKYDGRGQLLEESDGLGHVTTYQYMDEERTVVKRDPKGYESSVRYNMRGLPIEETDANGHTTRYRYNSAGLLASKTTAVGAVTSYEYDAAGNLVRVVDPRGMETVVTRDALGRATAIRDGEQHTEYYQYNHLGKVTSYTNRQGETTTYEYTSAGRISQMKDPLGNITYFEYNAEGKLHILRDDVNNGTVYTYNSRGWLEQVEEPEGKVTAYRYDAVGRLTYQRDGEGRETWYTYDASGACAGSSSPATCSSNTSMTTTGI